MKSLKSLRGAPGCLLAAALTGAFLLVAQGVMAQGAFASGALDPTFASPQLGNGRLGVNGEQIDPYVQSIAAQVDGKIVIAGEFSLVNGQARNNIARLNRDGTLDNAFNPNADGPILGVITQQDGKIVMWGSFGHVGGIERPLLARLNADGSLDRGFVPPSAIGRQDQINAAVAQDDGKLVFCGYLYREKIFVQRLNGDGTVDTAFKPNITIGSLTYDRPSELALQRDGKVVVGGSLEDLRFDGQVRPRIARLNTDGSLDSTFANPPIVHGGVDTIVPLADGKMLAGGTLQAKLRSGRFQERYQAGLTRINGNGTIDQSFRPNILGDEVDAVLVQRDGKIVIGGYFWRVNGKARRNVARLKADGKLDKSFRPPVIRGGNGYGSAGSVLSLAANDGKTFIAGLFTRVGGENRQGAARLLK